MSVVLFSRATVVMLLGGLALAGTALGQAHWMAPESEKGKKNPLAHDQKVIQQGQQIAKTNCVSCHGATGKGDGVAAAALNPKPADWTSSMVKGETDGELFWKISNGRGPMPPWKHLPENDRWAVIQYIRSLQH